MPMGLDDVDVLSNPLLGPLIGRPPRDVMPVTRRPKPEGKRVRWRLSQILSRCNGPLTAAQLRAATGFDAKEISAAIAKLVRAGEVRVIDNYLGIRKGYQWIKK